MARLIMRRGPNIGETFDLKDEIITLGRGSKNNIIIEDSEVSREHCRFVKVKGGYKVEDLESINGTFVDGQRVNGKWFLRMPCIIELGNSVTFEYDPRGKSFTGQHAAVKRQPTQPKAKAQEEVPYLVIVRGSEREKSFRLTDEVVNIGRELANDIVIQDPEISRQHARLRRENSSYVIEDRGSTNGIWLNGAKLTETKQLQPEDIIKLSSQVRLHFTWNPGKVQAGALSSLPPMKKGDTDETELLLGGSDTLRPNHRKAGFKPKTTKLGTGLLPGALSDHVLVAYSRADWIDIVAALTVHMQDAKLPTWVDQYLMPEAEDWKAAFDQAMRECWAAVIVVSPDAMDARSVKMTYQYFFNREKPVFPLIYKPVDDLPAELRNDSVIKYDEHNPDSAFNKLVFELFNVRK